jgi:cobalamin 5'-phosphate synthase/cobalamin synthase
MPVADQSRLSSPLRAAAAAVAFLTRVPVGRLVAFDSSDVARGAPFYPLVGAGVGVLVGLTASQLQRPLTAAVAAGVALLVGTLLTGALHLDALADCADALGAHSREQALQIMRDHAIGTYGATALVLDLLIKGAALAALARAGHVVMAAAVAGALARGAPALLASALPYARTEGTAAAIIERGSRAGAVASALIAIALASALLGSEGKAAVLVLVGAAAAVTTASGFLCHRWLGGISGDTLGATTEVVETLMLVGAVVLV